MALADVFDAYVAVDKHGFVIYFFAFQNRQTIAERIITRRTQPVTILYYPVWPLDKFKKIV